MIKKRNWRLQLPTLDKKRMAMLTIPYVIVFYLVDKLAWLYRYCVADSLIEKLGILLLNVQKAFENPMPSFYPYDVITGLLGVAIVKTYVYLKGKNAKKFRRGKEYGSARWSA